MYKSILIAGISCSLLLWCSFLYYQSTKLQNQLQLYLQSLELQIRQQRGLQFQDSSSAISGQSSFVISLKTSFERDDFHGVLLAIQDRLDKDPGNDYLLFNQAIVLLRLDDYDAAFDLLQTFFEQPDSRFRLDAAWMLSLIYIQREEAAKAWPLLDRIIQERGAYFKEALQLKKRVP